MSLSGRLLTLINLIGDIGAVVAAIVFWGENRALTVAAIAALLAILFLPGLLSTLGLILGLGLFAYAVAGNAIMAVSAAALACILMFILFERDQRFQQQKDVDRQVEEVSDTLQRVLELRREATKLDPDTPPEYAQPAELQGAKLTLGQPVALPLESYAPILHRGLTLAAEAMGSANDEEFRALQVAAGRLGNFRPRDPTLADLHNSAVNFVHAMFRSCDAEATARAALFTSNDRAKVEALRAEDARWEEEVQIQLEDVQRNIRDLYTLDRPLFDRLGFSSHELTWLYLDDIVDELEAKAPERETSDESQLVDCAECGTELLHDAAYCGECGAPQPRAS